MIHISELPDKGQIEVLEYVKQKRSNVSVQIALITLKYIR